jgi:hypothetical protein
MRNTRTGLAMLVLALALTAQLSFVSSSTLAQNSNSSTTEMQNSNSSMMMSTPRSSRCRRRCAVSYRSCLRSSKNARACRVRYRNCLRRCPQ